MTVPFDSATLKIGRQTGDVTAAWKAENAGITFGYQFRCGDVHGPDARGRLETQHRSG